METILKDINKRGFYKRYLILCLSWYGVYSSTIGKLEKKDIEVEEDKVIVHLKEKDICIKDRCAIDGMNKIYSHKNLQTYVIGRAERFTKQQIAELKSRCNSKVLDKNLNNIYVSGEIYRLSFGEKPNIGKDNTYLMPYYEAMSRFLYGEPLRSGEPLSSDEPTFDVEKEAEKYVPLSDWNVYVSTLSRDLLDERNIGAAKPYVATFLAWNGIPIELIKLLTTKTLSTDGQEKLFIGNEINEIEIEANKRTCDIVGRLIIEEPPGVLFEDPHNFTREEGRRVGYIFGQPPVLNTDIEIVYTSGILYRLAKFGQEPDDKENLNYYKAVAGYMYKGDD